MERMDKEFGYKIVDDMVFGTKASEFLSIPLFRDIAQKYVKNESRKGFESIINNKDTPKELVNYLKSNKDLFVDKPFFDDFGLAKDIAGRFFYRKRNCALITQNLNMPGANKVFEVVGYVTDMHTEFLPKIVDFDPIEKILANTTYGIYKKVHERKIPEDELLAMDLDHIFWEGTKGGLDLGLAPSYDKSFLYTRYNMMEMAKKLSPFDKVDYDNDHRFPNELHPSHRGDNGENLVVLGLMDKDPEAEIKYKRLIVDYDTFKALDKSSFIGELLNEKLFRAVKEYDLSDEKRIFGKYDI